MTDMIVKEKEILSNKFSCVCVFLLLLLQQMQTLVSCKKKTRDLAEFIVQLNLLKKSVNINISKITVCTPVLLI